MQNVLAILLFISWPFSDSEGPTPEITELHNQVKSYYRTNLDSAILLAEQAILKSTELNDDFGRAKSVTLLAQAYNLQGKTDQAVYHFLDALKLFMPIENASSLSVQANICLSVGKLYRQHHRVVEAIDFYDKGMGFALEALDRKTFVKLLHNKAVLYRKIEEPEKARELLTNKLEMIAPDNLREQLFTYNQLGLVHRDLGENDQALAYYNKILTLDTITNHSLHRGQAHHNMANIYQQQKDYTKSWSYFSKALIELEPLGRAKDLFITYRDMADLALLQDKRSLALSYAKKATPLLDELPDQPEYFDHYKLLSSCIEKKDLRLALSYSRLYGEMYEAFGQTQNDLISELKGYQIELATVSHEKRTLSEKYDRRMLIGSIIIGVSIILMSIGVFKMLQDPIKYRYGVYKKYKEEQNEKLKKEEAERIRLESKERMEAYAKDLEETRKLLRDQKKPRK